MRFTRNTSASSLPPSLSLHTATENEFANRSCRDCCQTLPHLPCTIPPGWKIPVTRRDITKTLFPSMMLSLRATLIPSRLDCKYGAIERALLLPRLKRIGLKGMIEQRSECVASTFITLALERKGRFDSNKLFITLNVTRVSWVRKIEYISSGRNRELRWRIIESRSDIFIVSL